MGTIANAKVTHYYNCYNGDFIGCLLFIWTQQIDSSISDGENVGRSISSLVYEGLIEVINPGHKPVKFRRIK